jgi:hypothetical protein
MASESGISPIVDETMNGSLYIRTLASLAGDAQIEELRSRWTKAGGGAKAALSIDHGVHMLPLWDEDHEDYCHKCDNGGRSCT